MSLIRGGSDFDEWLYRLDADTEASVSPVLTMRAALRVLPGLGAAYDMAGSFDTSWRERLLALMMRATSAQWAAEIYPAQAPRLRSIAFLASARAASIASGLQNAGLRDHGDSFALAPAGVIYTAYAIHEASTSQPAGEIIGNACAALSAIVGYDIASVRQAVFWRALDHDIGLFEAGTANQALAIAPLWGPGIDFTADQPELAKLWLRLCRAQSDSGEHSRNWAAWYYGRLEGGMPEHCILSKRPPRRRS